jgi:hypothetical protein
MNRSLRILAATGPEIRSAARSVGRLLILAAVCGIPLGCGPTGGGDPKVTQAAYDSLQAGKASLETGQIAEARDALEAATTKGGLQPDFYCEAVALLGRCEALLGNFDKARAAADILDQGDPDPARGKGLRELIRTEEANRPPPPVVQPPKA